MIIDIDIDADEVERRREEKCRSDREGWSHHDIMMSQPRNYDKKKEKKT